MYICPICKREFNTEESISTHSLKCWREHNPNHKSKPAPRSDDIVTTQMNSSILNFFEGLQCKK